MSANRSRSRTVEGSAASPVSYEGFDFRSLWVGREKTTAIELAIARAAFGGGSRERVLDAGAGFGRLFLPLRRDFRESVGLDANRVELAELARASRGDPAARFAVGNLYHLPFVDGAFSGAMMLRVYHHLAEPARVLAELRRVVAPGGRVLVSFVPGGTLAAGLAGVASRLRDTPWTPAWRSAFRGAEFVRLAETPFPIYSGTADHFARMAREAGLVVEREYRSGIEDFFPFRYLPLRSLLGLSLRFRPLPFMLTTFALCRVPGSPTRPLPALDEVFACPRCQRALGVDPKRDGTITCPHCGPVGAAHDLLPDLRFPPG